jgi:sugar phosphate permease
MTMAAPPPAPVAAGGMLRTLVATTAIQVITSATVLALSALAPEMVRATGLPAHWIGYQVSLIYLAGAVSSALAGAVIGRSGATAVEALVLGCLFVGVGAFLTASPLAIAAGSLLIGLGHGLNNPAASHLLGPVTPPGRRNIVFSIKQTGVPVGGIAVTLTLPWIAATHDWRLGLALMMALHVASATLLMPLHTPADPRADGGGSALARLGRDQALLWRSPALRALAVIGMLFSAIQLGLSAYVVVMLHDAGGLTVAEAGAMAAATHAAGVVGRLGWGWLADRTRSGFMVLAVIGGLCALAAGATVAWTALPALLQAGVLVVFGGTAIGWNGVLLAETAHRAPAAAVGASTGSVLVFVFIGAIVGPAAVGIAYGWIGDYFACMGLLAAFGAAGCAVAGARALAERTV